jgi:hypothetical protein
MFAGSVIGALDFTGFANDKYVGGCCDRPLALTSFEARTTAFSV